MDTINAAFQRLQSIKATRKGKDSHVDDAINQLSSVPRLLELPAASAATFTKLAEIFRARLLPLYHASLAVALDYAVIVLQFIHQTKIVPALRSGNAIHTWEGLLSSLLSGILDFLDEKSNTKHREIIASVLHPVLCPLYFETPSGSLFSEFGGDLLSVVYQLLMATIESKGRSAVKLRDHDIGSERLGLTILRTKDFLAMESLLDLFGSLIPLVKGGREKRSNYIKEVFNPSNFKCSETVIEHLEHISNPDWSMTSMKIIKTLADSDLSFPQPFDATSLVLHGTPFNAFFSFYVDKTRFIANLEKDGQVETLCIPFTTVHEITVSLMSNDEVQVTIHVTSPPTLGHATIHTASTGNVSVSWKIQKIMVRQFGKVLKSRNLSIGNPASKKLSKAKEIALDFDSKKQDQRALKQERVQSLSQLWAQGNSPRVIPTSPLVPMSIERPFPTLPIQAVDFEARVSIAPESPKPTVFLNSKGELFLNQPSGPQECSNGTPNSDEVHMETVASETKRQNEAFYTRVVDDGDDGSQIPLFKSKAPQTRKRTIVISDDDEVDKETDLYPQQPKSRQQDQITVSDPLPPRPTNQLPPGVKNQATKEVPQKKKQRKSKIAEETPNPLVSIEVVKTSRKRPAWDIDDEDDWRDDEARPAKRERREPAAVAPKNALPYQAKKYSRKGRISSPALSVASTVDFDEVPGLKQAEVALPSKPKTRASNMKPKNGKPAPKAKAKAAPAKVDEKKRETRSRATKATEILKVSRDPDVTLVNPNDIAVDSKVVVKVTDENNTRRATGTTADQTLNSIKPAVGHTQKKQHPRKSTKAPWEDKDFIQMIEQSSDPIFPLESQVQDSSKVTSDSATPSDEQDQPFVMKEEVREVSLENRYEDTVGAVKLGSSSSTGDDLQTQEVITIDLTLDESPAPPRKANGNATNPVAQKIRQGLSVQVLPEPELRVEEDFVLTAIQASTPVLKKNVPMNQPGAKISIPSSKSIVRVEARSSKSSRATLPTVKVERMNAPPPQLRVDHDLRRERPTVKFASPLGFDASFNSGGNFRDEEIPQPRQNFFPPPGRDPTRKRDRQGHASVRTGKQRRRNMVPEFEIEEDPMDRIVEVLNGINEALIRKVTRRFDSVSEDLHLGKRIILEGTENTLQEMCHQSVRHFNDMVDLEEEYISQCAKIDQATTDFRKTGEQLSTCFKNVTVDFSRRSLAKKFPTTLSGKTPAIILNPTLKL